MARKKLKTDARLPIQPLEDMESGPHYRRQIAELQARLNQSEGSLPEAVCEAYGWLWHAQTDDERVHRARRLLLSVMTKPQQRLGIEDAKTNGAAVSPTEEE